MNLDADVCAVLPSIRLPTLVMHRPEVARASVESQRYMAQRIPRARLVEFPGHDFGPPFGDQEALLRARDVSADAAEEKERTADWAASHTSPCPGSALSEAPISYPGSGRADLPQSDDPLLYPLSYWARGRRVAPRPHGDCPAAAVRARAERKGCHVSHALA